ncbi:hemolysin activation/secretion protein [Rubrivivax gelatinosus]|uniref:ShlB/FhaC/HecB family hemolysin secretion/activation protein n=2 Tax=Rubrivivax gelatinosus TaxID=28068 RepID=UPI0018CB94C9|nr:ShlB/FhaC/HecB family hemolysin secretion/activation protein [Rubrivivax gelatinosus]MBG6080641.1 hemolysin activation/secretion protein [Rubrivivax gelatinosus]
MRIGTSRRASVAGPWCSFLFLQALGAMPALAAPPDAGSLLQDLRPAPAAARPGNAGLPTIAEPAARQRDAGPAIAVGAIRITGASALALPELQALVADAAGRTLTLAELDELARRITRRYREAGYLLARAYLPAQEIRDGVVEIAVLEGRLGALNVHNRSGLDDDLVAARLADLRPGEALAGPRLERDLLLLSDLPGVELRSTLRPGASVGTTDLDVQLEAGRRWATDLLLDNQGNRYTGEWRAGANVSGGNLAGLGDTLALQTVVSSGLRHGRVAWQLPVGAAGTQLGAAWSGMRYRLGDDFSPLDAHGTAVIGSAYLLHPLLRSRRADLGLQAMVEHKRLHDDLDAADTRSRKSIDLLTLGASGQRQDDWLGGGRSQGSASLAVGHLGLDAAAEAGDAAGHRTAGRFVRLNLAAARTQALGAATSLRADLRAQAANGNLDSAEKMSLGGAQAVRAYPQGEASADDAWLATLELRRVLWAGWQASVFYDLAHGRTQHDPIAADGDNSRRLAGGGLGLAGSVGDFSVQFSIAWRDGSAPTSDTDRHPRAWMQAVQRF